MSPAYRISAEVASPFWSRGCCPQNTPQPARAAASAQVPKRRNGSVIPRPAQAVRRRRSASAALRRRDGKVRQRDALIDREADRGDRGEQDRDDRRPGAAMVVIGL